MGRVFRLHGKSEQHNDSESPPVAQDVVRQLLKQAMAKLWEVGGACMSSGLCVHCHASDCSCYTAPTIRQRTTHPVLPSVTQCDAGQPLDP